MLQIRAHENNVFEIVSKSMIVRTMSTNTPHMIPEDEEIQPVSDLTNIPEDDEEYKGGFIPLSRNYETV